MTGIIASNPPLIQQPPGSASSNPAGLPGATYISAVLNLAQTWTAKQTFPLGNITLNAADITGLTAAAISGLAPSATTDTTNASNISSGTLPAGRMPALTGDVTLSAGTTATTFAAGNAANLNSGTMLAARMPALTGDVTTSAGAVATTIAANAVTNAKLATMAAWTFKANNTSGAAVPTDITVDGLTLKASPAASDEVLIWDVAGAAHKKATVSGIGAAAGVSSLNTKTGALGLSVVKQVFTSSGTYTPTANMVYCIIECIGGGGGGGSAAGTVGQLYGGAGGGSGGYSRLVASAATIGASQTVTIGAGGNGGASGSNNGTAGGDTSVGTLCIGKGAAGGMFGSAAQIPIGGAGGVTGTGDLIAAGSPGGHGFYNNINATQLFPSGNGGSSIFGGGALGVHAGTAATAGNAATNYGGGGSGAQAANIGANAAGGNGFKGVVFITEYVIG